MFCRLFVFLVISRLRNAFRIAHYAPRSRTTHLLARLLRARLLRARLLRARLSRAPRNIMIFPAIILYIIYTTRLAGAQLTIIGYGALSANSNSTRSESVSYAHLHRIASLRFALSLSHRQDIYSTQHTHSHTFTAHRMRVQFLI